MEGKQPTCMEAYAAGVKAAEEALDASPGPILFQDEGSADEQDASYAMGWNTVWATEENRLRGGGFDSCATNLLAPSAALGASGARIENDALPNPVQGSRPESPDTSEALFDVLIEAVSRLFD